jgi:anti-sigma-K factor RskA
MSEMHVFDQLPGYALGILDDGEAAQVKRHIAVCAVCRKELQAFADTSARLAMHVPQPVPDEKLKDKVILSVRAASREESRRNLKSPKSEGMPSAIGFWETMRQIFRQPAGLWIGSAFAVILLSLLLLAVNNFSLSERIKAVEKQASSSYMQVIRLKGTDNAPGANAYVMAFRDERYGSVAITHAPLLDEEHVYQIWLHKNGEKINGGTFTVNEEGYGNLMVSAELPLGDYDAFGITIEPMGGSAQPTGEKVMEN